MNLIFVKFQQTLKRAFKAINPNITQKNIIYQFKVRSLLLSYTSGNYKYGIGFPAKYIKHYKLKKDVMDM